MFLFDFPIYTGRTIDRLGVRNCCQTGEAVLGRRKELRCVEERKTKELYADMLQDQLSDMQPLRRKKSLKVSKQQLLVRERYLDVERAMRG